MADELADILGGRYTGGARPGNTQMVAVRRDTAPDGSVEVLGALIPMFVGGRSSFTFGVADSGEWERIRPLISSNEQLAFVGKGSAPAWIPIDKNFVAEMLRDAQPLTGMQSGSPVNVAAGQELNTWYGPANALNLASGSRAQSADIKALGVGANINNRSGITTSTVIVQIKSLVGSQVGNAATLLGDTGELEVSVAAGVQSDIIIIPWIIQGSSAYHAPLDGVYAIDPPIVPGAAGPLRLTDDDAGRVYNPAQVLGTNNQAVGVLAHPDGAADVEYREAGRPLYLVSLRNASDTPLGLRSIAASGYFSADVLALIAAYGRS